MAAIQQGYECDGPERHEIGAPRQEDATAAAGTKENRAGRPCPVGWCHGRTWAVGSGSVVLNKVGRERLESNRAKTAHMRKASA